MDWTAAGVIVALLAFAGQNLAAIFKSVRRESREDGVSDQTMKGLVKTLGDLTEELGKVRDTLEEHTLVDASFHGSIHTEVASMKETVGRHGHQIEGLTSQLRLRVVGAADTFFTHHDPKS
jgi:hypothetical protein